jgi:hypothetical protein
MHDTINNAAHCARLRAQVGWQARDAPGVIASGRFTSPVPTIAMTTQQR